MSIETNSESLLGRSNFYSDAMTAATPQKPVAFADDMVWERTAKAPWKLELLTLFLRNQ